MLELAVKYNGAENIRKRKTEPMQEEKEEYLDRILNAMYEDEINAPACPRAETKRSLRLIFSGAGREIDWEEYVRLSRKAHEEAREERYLPRDILDSFLRAMEVMREITFDPTRGRYWICYYDKRKLHPCLFMRTTGDKPGEPAFFTRKGSAERYFNAVVSS